MMTDIDRMGKVIKLEEPNVCGGFRSASKNLELTGPQKKKRIKNKASKKSS